MRVCCRCSAPLRDRSPAILGLLGKQTDRLPTKHFISGNVAVIFEFPLLLDRAKNKDSVSGTRVSMRL